MRFTSTYAGRWRTLLLDVAQPFAEEDQAAIFLTERHMHVVEHVLDGLLDSLELRGAVTDG